MTAPRMSTDEDIDALDQICRRLAGFEEAISVEWLDGYMTALAAGPHRLSVETWLERMGEGVFARAYGDPEDAAGALKVIQTRWEILLDQLDPEQILDDADVLRLAPLMIELTDEDREQLVAEGHVKPDELHLLEQTGEVWAIGFIDATQDFPEEWPEQDVETEEGQHFDEMMTRIISLTLEAEELGEIFEELYEGEALTRDELIHEALYAAQDLRLYWVQYAPRPAPRRVGELPGRNDPCPCGSGKKFKKCHGAQMQ